MEFHLGSYMAARSIWKGAISFGLVNIPIQVFSAEQKEEYTSFSQLCQKGHKIKYKKWCPVEEREVPWSEIKKGYEITKDNYVVIEKEEIVNIKLKTTNTIEIKEFINSEEFDPLFVERSYYVGPDTGKKKKGSDNATKNTIPAKAYSLFVKILNETKKVAIGKVVLRDKEQLVALRAYQRGLVMNELSLGKTLVENLTAEEFDLGQYSDAYAKELEKLIEAKSRGEKVTIKEEEEKPEEPTDLLEALKASINTQTKSSRQKRSGGSGSRK